MKLSASLRRDVEALATRIGERNVQRARAYAQAAGYIEQSLRHAGFSTSRQTFEVEGVDCANIEAALEGAASKNEIVIIGAHYDSVIGSPGADDNGSGVAALLALARAFAKEKPPRTLRFVAFANEEPPHFQSPAMGSWRYAKRCRERKENIVAMLSLETIGYFSDEKGSQQYPLAEHSYPPVGNFIAFAANLKSAALVDRTMAIFRAHSKVPAEGGALPEEMPGVAWSDQWSFWQFGYPAVMLTDTAPFRNPHYHRSSDRPNTLDYERLAGVVEGLVHVIGDLVKA
ncbi:MAG TPA: M20/M25/M40 family metallo-hydrolase [Thermoanaerobaculia bacterium]|nr:M20/M25/M40 family metallo-hydrolase [Thermoanaerobaculia bacterium]